MSDNTLWIIFGNQLFPVAALKKINVRRVFMAEDDALCTHFKYHKQKLVLFLASMRRYAEELREAGVQVHYEALSADSKRQTYEEKVERHLRASPAAALRCFEIEDKFMETRMRLFAAKHTLPLGIERSLMFLTPRDSFRDYLVSQRKPFMKTFYQWQRQRLKVLVDAEGKPAGGKWSFDTENRKKLPKSVVVPVLPVVAQGDVVRAVSKLVDQRFATHPGQVENFWLPTSRAEALRWLDSFLEDRFANFGAYEDAMTTRHDSLFHSVLTPALNMGLLLPHEVVKKALETAEKRNVPMASLEGFVRQVIGWREFVRGIYQSYSDEQDSKNFFGHTKKLTSAWYEGTTGIAPLDTVIHRVQRLGWCHHIERLMVLSNLMLLCEVDPREVHRWFMEMFVDSSDWVMGPNVYGMGQFSDGGIFATKPYIGASNYLLKMSDFRRGDWCEEVDALFWSFLAKHSEFFRRNPRMNMLLKHWEKRTEPQRREILRRAEKVRGRLTTAK